MKIVLLITALLLVSNCGNHTQHKIKNNSNKSNSLAIDIDAKIEGQYLAILETINPQITSKITGAFTFSRDKFEDELVGDMRLTNGGANLIHAQYVRTGNRCPAPEDDINGDGIIDAKEGEKVYGKILIPLDGDLNSRLSHDGEFPIGDAYGNYIYSKVAKFSKFAEDLRQKLPSGINYEKLEVSEPLIIEGRAVVVHGVDEASDLPSTVQSIEPMNPYQSLPISCGIIQRVNSIPGRISE